MVLGIEGRSVVGNLRNVVSWNSRLAGLALFGICLSAELASAQDPAAVQPAPATAPPVATSVVYAPPRTTEDDEKKWRSTRSIKFSNALKAIAPTTAETKELTDAANLFVDRMTVPKYVKNLYLYVIEPAKRSAEGQLTQPKPRDILLKAMNARVAELLAENPPHHPDVQLGLVLLLESLNSKPTVTTPPTPAVPFTGSYKVLISVLEDSARPLQCRIHAASGLGRMGREAVVAVSGGDLTVVQRNEVATALAKVLVATESQGPEDGKVWFRCRVAEALGDCGVAFDLNGGSGFIDALMTAATNPAEHLRVRAMALRATTQLNWNGSTNVPLILHETAELHLEIAQGYNAALAANKRLPNADLPLANFDIYLSFSPMTATQANTLKWGLRNQVTRPGLVQHAPLVNAAYAVSLPVINQIVANPKVPVAIPAAPIAALDAWIKANVPKDRKPTGVSPKAVP
jgi:hypothetical protein